MLTNSSSKKQKTFCILVSAMGTQIKDTELLWKIAQKLKRLREERGLSQRDVFAVTDIHIARIETAKVNLSVSTLNELCKYFGITLTEFFRDMD
ncbi:helix-turn-helix domain-containing protein [Flavobacterium sp.]|uniref:helix-turn-helix domain-containing protein n=1 Tax=Flavobacterium sp. TaxID=239 RepID=UPI004033784C